MHTTTFVMRALFLFCINRSVFLTAAVLGALEAELRVFVKAHAPHLGRIFGGGGDEGEAVTAGSRGDLQQRRSSALHTIAKVHTWSCVGVIVPARLSPGGKG